MGLNNCYFGINRNTKERFFQNPDKIAVTGSGYFFCADAFEEEIYYYHIRQQDGFMPSGRLPGDYGNLEDLFVDADDNLYILDNRYRMIYKYSLAEYKF